MSNESQLKLLELQDQEAVKNSFYRYPRVSPHITQYEDHVEVKTIDNIANIYKIDEVVLYIIADFKWAPLWLIQQWYEDFNLDGYSAVENWINVGITWAETSTNGVFIRPTKFLLDMMDISDQRYAEIPFNLLNHTCAEEQIIFDISMGNVKSELWSVIKSDIKLPCYHPLKIKCNNDSGTMVIREEHFKLNRFNTQQLEDLQNQLKQSIMAKHQYTLEFNNFSLFPLVSYDEKNKLVTQKPDVVIPIPRIDSYPQSYSIELELTAKSQDRYDKIMQNYKNNLIYGKLFYLCGNARIAKLVKTAYQNVGGLGTCRLFIVPFIAPAQRISNFNMKEEEAQKTMLKLTLKSTKTGD